MIRALSGTGTIGIGWILITATTTLLLPERLSPIRSCSSLHLSPPLTLPRKVSAITAAARPSSTDPTDDDLNRHHLTKRSASSNPLKRLRRRTLRLFDLITVTVPRTLSSSNANADTNSSSNADTNTTDEETTTTQKLIHETLMSHALSLAHTAAHHGEVPIGALLVQPHTHPSPSPSPPNTTAHTFRILATAHNQIETTHDASAHAELLTLRRAASRLQNWRLPPDTTLYTTLEPCPMCLAASRAFRVGRVVYGATDRKLG